MGHYDNGMGNGWDDNANRSCNAVTAELEGKLPISKFKEMTQKQLVNHICTYDSELDPIDDWAKLETMTKKAILSCMVTNEWHHVGLFAKPVDYYEFDTTKFQEMV